MGLIIGWIATRTGLGSLVASLFVYVAIAVFAVGVLLGYGHHKYSEGRAVGASTERAAWVAQRDRDLAQQEADKKATQAEIDRLSAALQLEAQKRKDDQTDADLKRAQAASPTKKAICLPRNVGRALNRVGR